MSINKGQTLALAAVSQSCILLQRMARNGSVDENLLSRMVATSLVLEAMEPHTLFGGADGVRYGLQFITALFSRRPDPEQLEVLRLVNGILQVQGSLRRNHAVRQKLGNRLAVIAGESYQVPFPESAYASLNEAYTDTISQLKPRIIVHGEPEHLKNPILVAKVRSGLLAAVRAAYMWYQLGGRRWHLLLFRRQYDLQARTLLSE